MSSKLDPFFDDVFKLLTYQGLSYRTVCKSLLGLGVEISPQALRSWYVRRTQKISLRSNALPFRSFSSSKVLPVVPLQEGLFPSVEEGAASPIRSSRSLVSIADGPLSLMIQAEEQKLAAAAPMRTYLVPKKQVVHHP